MTIWSSAWAWQWIACDHQETGDLWLSHLTQGYRCHFLGVQCKASNQYFLILEAVVLLLFPYSRPILPRWILSRFQLFCSRQDCSENKYIYDINILCASRTQYVCKTIILFNYCCCCSHYQCFSFYYFAIFIFLLEISICVVRGN